MNVIIAGSVKSPSESGLFFFCKVSSDIRNGFFLKVLEHPGG